MRIGILGAGAVGTALGRLFLAAGHDVVHGVRIANDGNVSFADAVKHGDVIVIAVPYLAVIDVVAPLANALAGKIVVDATNPLNEDWSPLLLGQENSAAETIAGVLPNARMVKAFNTVFADNMNTDRLTRLGTRVTTFVAADDAGAAATVSDLAASAGFAPVKTGPLGTARYLEAMAHLNIAIAVGQSGGTNAAILYHQAA